MEEQQVVQQEQPVEYIPFVGPPVDEEPTIETQQEEAPEPIEEPVPVIRHGYLTCPECAEKGIPKTFNDPRGLGLHRRIEHNVLGSSSGALDYRRKKEAEAKQAQAARPVGRPSTRPSHKGSMRNYILDVLATQGPTARGELVRKMWRPGPTGTSTAEVHKVINRLKTDGKVVSSIIKRTSGGGRGVEMYSLVGTPAEKIKSAGLKCPYCPQVFAGVRWRSRHINIMHPGAASASPAATEKVLPPPANLQPVQERKGSINDETTQAKLTTEEFIGYTVGQLKSFCQGLADQANLSAGEFTKRCAERLLTVAFW